MKKIITNIQDKAIGRTVFKFFIGALIIYVLMLFYSIPKIEDYAQGMKILDLLPSGYTYEYVMSLFDKLGEVGRNLYLYLQLPLDFIYPGLFAISCSLLLFWLYLKVINKNSKVFYLCLAPFVAGVFDYVENMNILYMLISYPNLTELQVAITSTATIFKSGFTIIFWFLLIIGSIMLIKQKFQTAKG